MHVRPRLECESRRRSYARPHFQCGLTDTHVALSCGIALAGIKKPRIERYRSKKGVDPKMLKNARFARKGDAKAVKAKAS